MLSLIILVVVVIFLIVFASIDADHEYKRWVKKHIKRTIS